MLLIHLRSHYTKKTWHKRESLTKGQKNVWNERLVKPEDILLITLHIGQVSEREISQTQQSKTKEEIFVLPTNLGIEQKLNGNEESACECSPQFFRRS